MAEEIFDVVDENDRPVGRAPRREVHARGLLHRAVHVLVIADDGRILLQRRSATKDTFPNCWGASASGHVDAGEDYDTCVVRELREEVGLTPAEPPRRIIRLTPCEETGREFVWVYACRAPGKVVAAESEVSATGWYTPAEIDAWVAAKPAEFTPSFVLLWKQWRSGAGTKD